MKSNKNAQTKQIGGKLEATQHIEIIQHIHKTAAHKNSWIFN